MTSRALAPSFSTVYRKGVAGAMCNLLIITWGGERTWSSEDRVGVKGNAVHKAMLSRYRLFLVKKKKSNKTKEKDKVYLRKESAGKICTSETRGSSDRARLYMYVQWAYIYTYTYIKVNSGAPPREHGQHGRWGTDWRRRAATPDVVVTPALHSPAPPATEAKQQ